MSPLSRSGTVAMVAACGNAHAGDDAFGPRVTARLREEGVPDAVLVDLDTQPAALLDHLPGPPALIVVDAVLDARATSRELVEFDWRDAEPHALAHDDALSSHGLGLADQLRLAGALDLLPPIVRLVGMRTAASAHTRGGDEEFERVVAEAVERIRAFVASHRDRAIASDTA